MKIVPDRSILKKIREIDIDKFLKDARALLGGQAELATTWCIDGCLWTAIKDPPPGSSTCVNKGTSSTDISKTRSDIPTLGHWTCVSRERCSGDVVCLLKLTGEVNSENFVIAPLESPETYNRCPRVPVMTYNSRDVLVMCKPSPEQLAFSHHDAAEQEKDILKQASEVSAELKRFKQSQRKKI